MKEILRLAMMVLSFAGFFFLLAAALIGDVDYLGGFLVLLVAIACWTGAFLVRRRIKR